ncbi:MAG: SRPBCC domain-containing protein [Steroidobacteraceae bacterium]
MADIVHRVGIKSSVGAAYQALATREGVAGWWTDDVEGESRVGSTLGFRFSAGGKELGRCAARVLDLRPNAVVRWQVTDGPAEWVGTHISFELKQEGEYAIVLFRHQGWKEPVEFMHHCSTKWAIFMMSLKALVETGQGAPSPKDIKIDNWN